MPNASIPLTDGYTLNAAQFAVPISPYGPLPFGDPTGMRYINQANIASDSGLALGLRAMQSDPYTDAFGNPLAYDFNSISPIISYDDGPLSMYRDLGDYPSTGISYQSGNTNFRADMSDQGQVNLGASYIMNRSNGSELSAAASLDNATDPSARGFSAYVLYKGSF